jgi:hypothetical protein
MARILRRESSADAAPASSEIEFALVLSRMINSITEDPEQLRASLYELARHKLEEQVVSETPEEQSRILDSLEVAIKGVETHYSRMELRALEPPEGRFRFGLLSFRGPPKPEPVVGLADEADRGGWRPFKPHKLDGQARSWKFMAPWRYVTVLALAALVGVAVYQRANLASMLKFNGGGDAVASNAASKPVPVAAEQVVLKQAEPAPDPLVPTTFGVYAISDGKLYTLEMLPGRAPHPRVAISPAISAPPKTVLPDPDIKFVVFRRDSVANALSRAEVRVIARISTEMKFDSAGKPVVTKADNTWVIRNVSYPYRTAPYKGQPDMYEVIGAEPDRPLTPGRYALILKDEAYDFGIAGQITDSKQCLESVAAANGAFYAECQNSGK